MTNEEIRHKCHLIIKLRYALLCDNAVAIEQASQELGDLIEAEKNTPLPPLPSPEGLRESESAMPTATKLHII